MYNKPVCLVHIAFAFLLFHSAVLVRSLTLSCHFAWAISWGDMLGKGRGLKEREKRQEGEGRRKGGK